MPDRALVAYLRKNLPRFGAPALKAKLLEEGVSEEDFESGLAAARKARSNPGLLPFLALAAAAVSALLIYLAASRSSSPRDEKPRAAAPPSGRENGPGENFLGHYGYMLRLPPGYVARSEFKDPQRTQELVYLFPENTDPSNLANEGLYSQLGILRLEVSPKRLPQGPAGLEALRAWVQASMRQRKAIYALKDASVGGMQGLLLNVNAPAPLTQAFAIGNNALYVLTGGAADPLFNEVLASLHESSSNAVPRGE